ISGFVRGLTMNDTILVSTRKGLFWVGRKNGSWDIEQVDFLGDNVSLTLTDPISGRHFVALDHGHFGVIMHRSTATGWEEIAAPAYPPKPDGYEEYDMWSRPLNWSTARIWALRRLGARPKHVRIQGNGYRFQCSPGR